MTFFVDCDCRKCRAHFTGGDTEYDSWIVVPRVQPVQAPSAHHPVEWGPSDARRLTCSCGNHDPAHMDGVNASDDWQQYAKEGETAQACIERHRHEMNGLLKLLAQARTPLTGEQVIALLPAGWTGMLAQVMEFARRIEAARGVGGTDA